jgi:2-polyprenyl-6-methoxyphenol hydroxylase-like FAD-dependent oxidoreductase
MSDTKPIIIAGAGPVGLVCALNLARQGVPSVLLEMDEDLPRDLRASTFHPPTLDMLESLGVGQDFIDMGIKTRTWQIRMHETGERAEFDLDVLKDDTGHPYRLQCEQFKLTPILLKLVRATGLVDVRFGTRLTGFRDLGDHVVVDVETKEGPQRIEGAYLVGADGAHSKVRSTLKLTFDGQTYPSVTILVTTPFRFEEHIQGLSGANYFWSRSGTFSLFWLSGEWRCTFYPRPGETDEEALRDESIESHLQEIVRQPQPYVFHERRAYRVHQRVTTTFRVGRAMIAGDAAHLNPPTGGMGMNGGIHDAINLSEKLARVWNGESDKLLDLYDRQRRPVAIEQILQQAHQNRSRLQETDPERRIEHLRQLQAVTADPGKMREFLLRSSMIIGLRQAAAIQ